MKSLPILLLAISFWLLALISPAQAQAIARWGPHLACFSSPQMLSLVREKYNAAGQTDWIPATIIITTDMEGGAIAKILTAAGQNLIIPTFRLEHPSLDTVIPPEVAKAAAQKIIAAVGQAGVSFPRPIYVEVGNEPNLWPGWGSGTERITNYQTSLAAFLAAAKDSPIKTLNAALDISNPTASGRLSAEDFWGGFPGGTLGQLSGVAFNPYQITSDTSDRYSIFAWRWERDNLLGPRGAPQNPVFLIEFGLNPDPKAFSFEKRLSFLADQYRQDAHPVEAITPLVINHENNTYKIPIFGPDKVEFISPVGGGGCGGGGQELIAEYSEALGGDLEIKQEGVINLILAALVKILPFGGDQFSVPELSYLSQLREAVPALSPYKFNFGVTADTLKGQNFNPGCNLLADGNPVAGADITASKNIDYDIPKNTADDIGYLAFFQAVTTPKKSVASQVYVKAPEELTEEEKEAANKYLAGNCSGGGGNPTTVALTSAGNLTEAEVPEAIRSFLADIIENIICAIPVVGQLCNSGEIVQIHKDRNFCPGCQILGEESMNTFNSRLPRGRALPVEDATVTNEKNLSGDVSGTEPVDTVFPALGNVETAHEDFQRSLYPWKILKTGARPWETTESEGSTEEGPERR